MNEIGLPQPAPLVQPRPARGLLLQAPGRSRDCWPPTAKGLIVLSGCPSAEVPRHPARRAGGRRPRGHALVPRRVRRAATSSSSRATTSISCPRSTASLVRLARELELPLVATNDVHYARAGRRTTPTKCCCASRPAPPSTTPNACASDSHSFYLRTEAEMRALFPELPDAIENTGHIADQCDVHFEFGRYKLPIFEVPGGQTAASFMRQLCEAGLLRRYGDEHGGEPPAARLRAGHHPPDGLRRLLPHRVGPVPLRPGTRHLVERAGLGRRLHRGLHPGHHQHRSAARTS